MRLSSSASVVVAVLLLAAPVVASAQTETETVERTLRLPANGTVSLRNFSGDVRISAAGGNDVVIKALRRATRDRLDHIKLDIVESGSTIRIEANKRDEGWKDRENNVVETEFEIGVPASAKLDVKVFSSSVTVSGVTGDQRLETFSGDITVQGARGALTVKSFNGDIEADLTGAGGTPSIEAETFSGHIGARFAENARGRVEFASFSGSLDTALPLTNQTTSRRNVRGDLPGGAGDTLRFKTFSGQLKINR